MTIKLRCDVNSKEAELQWDFGLVQRCRVEPVPPSFDVNRRRLARPTTAIC